jgi:hypothetical protein
MSCRSRSLLLLLLVSVAAAPAGAVPVEFDDRSAWDAAVTSELFFEDFDGITGDASFSSAPLDVGPFTLEQIGDPSQMGLSSTNLIDETPFKFSGTEDVNGSTYVLGFVDFSGDLYSGVVIGVGGLGGGQRFGMDDVTGATVPEPSTAGMLALGLAGLAVVGRRRH